MQIVKPVAMALGLMLAACSTQTSSEPAGQAGAQARSHAQSGLEVIDLAVISGEARHEFAVELAVTPEEQSKGLMFRTELAKNEGMLFPRSVPDTASFWMKNTPLSLDIIFIAPDRTIINIAANTEPYSIRPVVAAGATGAVLEIPAGRAAELGITAGDRVEW